MFVFPLDFWNHQIIFLEPAQPSDTSLVFVAPNRRIAKRSVDLVAQMIKLLEPLCAAPMTCRCMSLKILIYFRVQVPASIRQATVACCCFSLLSRPYCFPQIISMLRLNPGVSTFCVYRISWTILAILSTGNCFLMEVAVDSSEGHQSINFLRSTIRLEAPDAPVHCYISELLNLPSILEFGTSLPYCPFTC
ncbi:hypothetical protein GALMADRAFT_744299 [Galerina marginata CBS 339.88]|uniref:Uncharacterized protein n=1 Tax=Galerina marginata (strain CBS 339.88) TaxID=685588 RepID=A0A067T1Y2_GALM3|nr:hypothetical protein GALMADRAFT_744299 [Galerina marginata CBS 339.88]